MDRLPFELIAMIIAPTLRIPDETFTHTASSYGSSPFSKNVDSHASDMLLISRRFCEVATSLLWDTVVIRSKAQASALARALKEHPEFGGLIKKMRIEGGFGDPMLKILQAATAVTSLALSLDLLAADNPSYSKLLSTKSIKTLVILHSSELRNNNNSKLLQTICACFPSWSQLTEVYVPYNIGTRLSRSAPFQLEACEILLDTLLEVPNLEHFHLSYLSEITPKLAILAQKSTLRSLSASHSAAPAWWYSATPKITDVVQADVRLGKLIRWRNVPHEITSPDSEAELTMAIAVDPSWVAFAGSDSQTSDALWSRIMGMVAEEDLYHELGFYPNRYAATSPPGLPACCALTLVSQHFKDLAIPAMYYNVSFTGQRKARPSIALSNGYSHHIRVATFIRWPDVKAAIEVIEGSPNLKAIRWTQMGKIPTKAFEEICGSQIGPKILEMPGFQVNTAKLSPTPLQFLVNLTELTWSNRCTINKPAAKGNGFVVDLFPQLHTLNLANYDSTFLNLLNRANLPALRHIDISHRDPAEQVLKVHGHKLTSLTITEHANLDATKYCTNIKILNIPYIGPSHFILLSDFLRTDNPRTALKEINWGRSGAKVTFWQKFFERGDGDFFISKKGYPALETFKIHGCRWPEATERAIKRDPWVARAELLAESGVQLVDQYHKGWRARLK